MSKGIAIKLRQKILTSGGRAIHLPKTPEVLINKTERLSNIKCEEGAFIKLKEA